MRSLILHSLLYGSFCLSTACTDSHAQLSKEVPVKLEALSNTEVKKITLSPLARKRLGVESAVFASRDSTQRQIPVSAMIYDNRGTTWIYVEASPDVFHREAIHIVQTQGEKIQIESHLSSNTLIVTTGAAELYGAESEVGK